MKVIKRNINSAPREKRFLGAALGIAQLGLGIVGAISQAEAQRKAVEANNKAVAEMNAKQLDSMAQLDSIAQRNFTNNSPMNSFYANGGRHISGVKQITPTEAVAFGATHNESNPKQGGTGIPYRNIEVEGGGKNGNKPGEVIKQNSDGDFIFSDRIMYDDKHTFAQVAQNIVQQKALMQQTSIDIRNSMDRLNDAISKAGSAVKSSTISRDLEKVKTKDNEVKATLANLETQLKGLQDAQLQKGIQMGIYNPDGTPKNTQDVPPDGQTVEDQQQPQQEQQQMAKGGRLNIPRERVDNTRVNINSKVPVSNMTSDQLYDRAMNTNGVNIFEAIQRLVNLDADQKKADDFENATNAQNIRKKELLRKIENNNHPKMAKGGFEGFMSSNAGQGALGLLNTGINLISNINTANQMSKLKVPTHTMLKAPEVNKVNYSADREVIKESIVDASNFAKNNYANPNVAMTAKQRAISAGLKQEAQINQTEQNANTQIEAQNAQQRLNVDQINDQNFVQDQMMQLNKDQQDINNRQNITAGLTKDLQTVAGNYQKGIQEEKVLNMYERTYAPGVATRTAIAANYKGALDELDNASDEASVNAIFDKYNMSQSDREAYLRTRQFKSMPTPSVIANNPNLKAFANGIPFSKLPNTNTDIMLTRPSTAVYSQYQYNPLPNKYF